MLVIFQCLFLLGYFGHAFHTLYKSTPTRSTQRFSSEQVECSIALNEIKNMRDLSSAISNSNAHMSKGKIYRTGCVSKASVSDIDCCNNVLGINAYIDLRSDKELEEDEHLNSKIYEGCTNYYYDKRSDQFQISKDPKEIAIGNKKRFFISLMSESLIKKGTFFRLSTRSKLKVFGLLTISALSRRANKKLRKVFLDKINAGGLKYLSELVLAESATEIIQVMKVISTPEHLPVALYCTAGKDRTGLLSMLILSVIGASDEEIVADYILSDKAYEQINDKKAMAMALQQTDVDPDVFLGAKADVMIHIMDFVRLEYGSINGFLDKYGFDESWRTRLRECLSTPVNV